MANVSDLKTYVAALTVGVAALGAGAASAGTYTLIAPYSGIGTTTGVNGINDAGYITGVVGNADGSSDGFIRTPGGAYTLFQVPGSNGFDTYGRDINNSNVVTGYSTDSSGTLSTDTEFTRSAGGVISILTNPGTGAPLNGVAGAINASGEIVGDYIFTSGSLSYRHGYLLNGSSFTDISASPLNTEKTEARGVTDSGNVIVGFEKDATTGEVQGFVDTGGVFQFVSDPSVTNSGVTYLEVDQQQRPGERGVCRHQRHSAALHLQHPDRRFHQPQPSDCGQLLRFRHQRSGRGHPLRPTHRRQLSLQPHGRARAGRLGADARRPGRLGGRAAREARSNQDGLRVLSAGKSSCPSRDELPAINGRSAGLRPCLSGNQKSSGTPVMTGSSSNKDNNPSAKKKTRPSVV